jgi:c-di-GMP-binding flagellar brake protein YcgR
MRVDKKGSDKDNRKYKRLRVNLSVIYRINKPTTLRMMVGNKEIRSTMLDLSEGGLSLLTDTNIPLSAVLLIKFTLFRVEEEDVSFYGPMEIMGEVRYNMPLGGSEYRLGISFQRISKQDQVEIANFVRSTNLL